MCLIGNDVYKKILYSSKAKFNIRLKKLNNAEKQNIAINLNSIRKIYKYSSNCNSLFDDEKIIINIFKVSYFHGYIANLYFSTMKHQIEKSLFMPIKLKASLSEKNFKPSFLYTSFPIRHILGILL